MCCKNKSRSSGGCHGRRRDNKNKNPPLIPGQLQDSTLTSNPRTSLMGMFFKQRMAQTLQANHQQQGIAYNPNTGAVIDGSLEDQKIIERTAQAVWDAQNTIADAGLDVRDSRVSVGTELPSYGQALKQ